MKPIRYPFVALLVLAGCWHHGAGPQATSPANGGGPGPQKQALPEARRGFTPRPVPASSPKEPVEEPPARVFRTVRYDSPVGKLAAYLSPDPNDGKKHPAIVWITGGDCNSIGDVWGAAPANNEQTASAYRKAGIPMMFPSLRGGNNNPGAREYFFGEVDDVLAAADFLAKQEFVDPDRIYLGGHSTGGTLAFLVAESSDRFRAVFSFGPVDDPTGYGREYAPFDKSDRREVELRSPGKWLDSVRSPLFVFEGTAKPGNLTSLQTMQQGSKNPLIHFHPVKGATHFTILAPTNQLIASRILKDEGPTTNLAFTEEELNKPFGK
jgi:acetyl esterase/lipase